MNLRLTRRLELRRSNAAVPHRNRDKERKLPGKGNRNAERRKAIRDQR